MVETREAAADDEHLIRQCNNLLSLRIWLRVSLISLRTINFPSWALFKIHRLKEFARLGVAVWSLEIREALYNLLLGTGLAGSEARGESLCDISCTVRSGSVTKHSLLGAVQSMNVVLQIPAIRGYKLCRRFFFSSHAIQMNSENLSRDLPKRSNVRRSSSI